MNFYLFTEFFNKGASHSILAFANSVVTHNFDMKYHHLTHHRSVEKFFKVVFHLRISLLSLLIVYLEMENLHSSGKYLHSSLCHCQNFHFLECANLVRAFHRTWGQCATVR